MLLAGLVRCGKCGASYQLESSGKVNSAGKAPHRYYNCRSFVRTGKEKCPGFRIPMKVLDKALLEHMAGHLFSDDRCRTLLRSVVDETAAMRQKTVAHRQQIQQELADIDRRIERWEEAFETGTLPPDMDVGRIRLLKTKRDELALDLTKVIPLRTPPGHLYTEASLREFQASLRELFFDGEDQVMAKHYLRFLIEKIVVTDAHVEVEVRSGAALKLLAAGGAPLGAEGGVVNRQMPVLATDDGWLPEATGSKNFVSEFIIDLDAYRKRRAPRELKLPPVVGHLQLAERFQSLLDSGEAPNRAWLAREHGLTRARVTQLMSLLLLHPDILDYVRNLSAGTPERLVTEKKLRRFVRLPFASQLKEAEKRVPGFAAHETARRSAAG